MSGKWSGLGVAVAVAWLGSTYAGRAHAFCLTKSCELGEKARKDDGGPACPRDENECVTEGQPLRWGSPCIQYAVQADGSVSTELDGKGLQQATAAAFAAWEDVSCPGGGSPRFHAQFQGFVHCNRHDAVCGDASKNVNVIMFHDRGWPSRSDIVGLTTPSGLTRSGLLNDADLELNSQDYDFNTPSHAGDFELSDTLTHEIGHFLGLGHSREEGALMSEGYDMLQLSRELLTADDVAAICSAYPPGAPLDCPAPSAPAYDQCQLEAGAKPKTCVIESMTHEEKSGGCSIAGVGSHGGWRLAGAAVLLGALRRRRATAAGGTKTA